MFARTDLAGSTPIRAVAASVTPEMRRTVISAAPADPLAPTVQTVEHLLSALAGLGITDAWVEVDGPEIPIGDGSSLPFVEAIERAGGVRDLGSQPGLDPVIVREPIVIEFGDGARIEARPAAGGRSRLEYRLDYTRPDGSAGPIAPHAATIEFETDRPSRSYVTQIAPARTFCLRSEAEAMRRMGLFAHLTARDMLVIDDASGLPIDNEFRFRGEPARHKLLDLIGDLALVGRPVWADISAVRTGHAQTHEMARRLSAL